MSWGYIFAIYEEDDKLGNPKIIEELEKYEEHQFFGGFGFRAKNIDYAIKRALKDIRFSIKDEERRRNEG